MGEEECSPEASVLVFALVLRDCVLDDFIIMCGFDEKDEPYLTDMAPTEAYKSFQIWKEIQKKKGRAS